MTAQKSKRNYMNDAPSDSLGALERRARALLGWMNPQEAAIVQAGRDVSLVNNPNFERRAKLARESAEKRSRVVDQANVLEESPVELRDYLEALFQHPAAQAMLAEGWEVKIADLERVRAIQPTIFVDAADERVRDAKEGDIVSLASVTLPIPESSDLPAQYDQVRQAWIIAGRNPNLRIVGNFGGEVQPGIIGFGFAVQLSPSFMQVASLGGRLLLRDGYHRAYGLLRRGITRAPVFAREFPSFEALALNPGMLPQDAYLGSNPALLPDYLDDQVSADVQLPASQKMIVIQGIELNPLG